MPNAVYGASYDAIGTEEFRIKKSLMSQSQQVGFSATIY